MSLKIRKQTGEIFDLPPDFIIEGEKNSPLFTVRGSQTVSITFPSTPHNRRLLDDAARLDRSEKPGQTVPVAIESGGAQQTGLMAINSASPAFISANIGFDEAELYSRMGEVQLKDLPDLPSVSFGGATTAQKVASMMAHLTAVMNEEVEADYFIFPVTLKSDTVEPTEEQPDAKIYQVILNELYFNHMSLIPWTASLKSVQHRLLAWLVDGEEVYIDAPPGYGASPFLKVWRILELIFDRHFNCKIEENPFRTHRQLRKLVMLNNVMDAVVTGTLHYRDMMPDLTVKAFLDMLYNRFGMLYFIDSNTQTVRLRFLRDILTLPPSVDLDAMKTEEPSISYSPQKQLRITAIRGAAGAFFSTAVLRDTYEEFLDEYDHQFTDFTGQDIPSGDGVDNCFSCAASMYLIFEQVFPSFQAYTRKVRRSSDFFDWDRKTPGLEYEEISHTDISLPFDKSSGRDSEAWLFYGEGMKHRYSNVVVEGETRKEDENAAQPAMAFGWGMTKHTAPGSQNWFWASQINRNAEGDFMYDEDMIRYDISLTVNREDGLFNRFWKEYDAFLRHSAQEVKCSLKLPDAELVRMRTDCVMLLNFQPLVPEQFRFKLNDPRGICEAVFRTLRLYEPYDLEAEQGIPVYIDQKYWWKPVQVNVPQPSWTPDSIEADDLGPGFVTVDGRNVSTNLMFILPPTDAQYLALETIQLVYSTIWKKAGEPDVSVTSTVTYTPTLL
ncbi:MAG: hypothetical protein LBF85_01995 [Tannerella sp.]|jgi:hypothetical protein|nr:hypothetical protein [Tannerella sp.]